MSRSDVRLPISLILLLLVMLPGEICTAAPNPSKSPVPQALARLDHIAVWVADLERTAERLQTLLGWRRHPAEFGVNEDSVEFGGMKLAFVDANGIWLELVQPTTPGPGLDLLKQKGDGSLVELDCESPDFERSLATLETRGVNLVGMDGKTLPDGGRSNLWMIKDGRRVVAGERVGYLPLDVSHHTAIELYWEYPTGIVRSRDASWPESKRTPRSAPRADHTVVLAEDVEKTAEAYTRILGFRRVDIPTGPTRDWLGLGAMRHLWIDAGGGAWIEVVGPSEHAAPTGALQDPALGDGAILELGVEVPDLSAFAGQIEAKGTSLTSGDGNRSPASRKMLVDSKTGDRYAYLPKDAVQGIRIRVFQRGSPTSSLFSKRDSAGEPAAADRRH